MKSKLLLRAAFAACSMEFLAFAVSEPASAQFSINSPKVEKGELEVETHGSVQSGFPKAGRSEEAGEEAEGAEEKDEKPVRQGHEFEISYGLTDFWAVELGITVQKPSGDGFEASALELQNTFQLATIERWNMTVGFLASASLGIGEGEPNAVEFGPLIQFGDEKTGSLILNTIFEKTFGPDREEGLGFEYAAQFRYPLTEKVGLGVEGYGEIEDIGHTPRFEDTELRVGPMVYFSFGDDDDDKGKGKGKGGDDDDDKGLKAGAKEPEIEIGMGVLFGATDATPDVTFKWDVGVAF